MESIPRRSKSQLSQPGKRKGYPDSQSSDERPWLDSPVDTDDITVQVPPPVPVSIYSFTVVLAYNADPISNCVPYVVPGISLNPDKARLAVSPRFQSLC